MFARDACRGARGRFIFRLTKVPFASGSIPARVAIPHRKFLREMTAEVEESRARLQHILASRMTLIEPARTNVRVLKPE